MSTGFFTKIKHWGGIVIADVIKGLNKTTAGVDEVAPTIEKDLQEGASLAALIPGAGPEVAAGLNLGAELTGALNKTLDYTDADFQKIVAQAQSAIPASSGLSVVLVASDIVAEAKAWFSALETSIATSKAAATAITGTGGAPAAGGAQFAALTPAPESAEGKVLAAQKAAAGPAVVDEPVETQAEKAAKASDAAKAAADLAAKSAADTAAEEKTAADALVEKEKAADAAGTSNPATTATGGATTEPAKAEPGASAETQKGVEG